MFKLMLLCTEMFTDFLTISIVGINLSNSVFSETGIEPGLDDEAPISNEINRFQFPHLLLPIFRNFERRFSV